MKKTTLLKRLLALSCCIGLLTACGSSGSNNNSDGKSGDNNKTGGNQTLNVWSFNEEVSEMIARYKKTHPDFGYEINATVIALDDGAYQAALDQALSAGGKDAPDLYVGEAAIVLKYTQGAGASYALSYADLGIDIDTKIAEAAIAPYAVEIGTRPDDNAVVGLPFQSTGGAYIYRRSIAKEVFGTDDPDVIKTKIGPGWDQFMAAASELKAKGYSITSSTDDIWNPLFNSAEQGWVVDEKLFIDPAREQYFDLAKAIVDNGYTNDTKAWTEPWFADMKDAGVKPVFGFFGPAWLINYTLAGNSGGTKPGEGTYGDWAVCEPTTGFSWGGSWLLANKDSEKQEALREIIEWITLDTSETGLQYLWANGTLNGEGGTKDTVAAGTVMEKSDGTLDFLGGQNMFDVFVPANDNATGKNKTEYDEAINIIWQDQLATYVAGNKTKEEALAEFKQLVQDTLGIEAK